MGEDSRIKHCLEVSELRLRALNLNGALCGERSRLESGTADVNSAPVANYATYSQACSILPGAFQGGSDRVTVHRASGSSLRSSLPLHYESVWARRQERCGRGVAGCMAHSVEMHPLCVECACRPLAPHPLNYFGGGGGRVGAMVGGTLGGAVLTATVACT